MLQKWVRPDGVHFWTESWGVVIREVPDATWVGDAFRQALLYIKVPGDEEGKLFPDPPNTYSDPEFNVCWNLIPDWIQHEIIECFYEVNPAYREGVAG